MSSFEYRVIPAPEKAGKHKGLKGAAKFAATLEQVMNEMGAEGWEYLRADILPQTERAGLTGTQTTYRTFLVFSRPLVDADDAPLEDVGTEDDTPAGALPTQAPDSAEAPSEPEPTEPINPFGSILQANDAPDRPPKV